ncbi:MAG TPA: lipopolysaccharide heptosyltransferase II [Candidatus Eisenbacteria bacterium]|nr:lipopolysaccharide heptosyltransferase II [Candidatus Eisenbacteria bacterium]
MTGRGDGPLLLRIPNWLGDLVLAMPVIEAAAAGPLIALGPEPFGELLEPRYPSLRYLPVSRGRRWAQAGAIRALRPSRALLLTESLSSAILAWLARVPVRVGYAAEGRSLFLTRAVPRAGPARSTARVHEYQVLAEAAGLAVGDATPRLAPTPSETDRARALLRESGLSEGTLFAVIAPGASYGPTKQWGPERFATVAASLDARGIRCVLVGASADRDVSDRLRRAADAPRHLVDLTGRTSLGELVGVLAASTVVVSNDSGVMHVAAALGRPTVAIFGSTSPVWTSADAPTVVNLYAAYPCSPCFRRTCPIGYGCLHAIATEDVIEAAARMVPRSSIRG